MYHGSRPGTRRAQQRAHHCWVHDDDLSAAVSLTEIMSCAVRIEESEGLCAAVHVLAVEVLGDRSQVACLVRTITSFVIVAFVQRCWH